ncbi:MAG: ParB/RepB/Spo0J family partition protein [Defluviitaleaceae bacterium]|nr:ParB/RepB/Spo0J family partition protein [Defluviitaleaceae bacterium]
MAKTLTKPNITKPNIIADLFGVDTTGITSITSNTNSSDNNSSTNKIIEIDISNLIEFHNHPFRVNDDEAMEDLVASVAANGVLLPVLVRPAPTSSQEQTQPQEQPQEQEQSFSSPSEKESLEKRNELPKYELLAGHRRTKAASLVGLTKVPAIILNNLSDEDAMAYVIETNLMQRSFSDMRHSEKAAVIALHHSKMFSQGKRNDILEQLAILDGSDTSRHSGEKIVDVEDGTIRHNGERISGSEKYRSDELVGEMYSLSPRTVSRYLRIAQLNQTLKELLDKGRLDFLPAVTLSFLTKDEQEMVSHYLTTTDTTTDYTINTKKADALRELSKTGELTPKSAILILQGQLKGQAEQKEQTEQKEQEEQKEQKQPSSHKVKISPATYNTYFTPEQSPKEVEGIVERALGMWFASQIMS